VVVTLLANGFYRSSCAFPMFNFESRCITAFKVERVMSFPAREQKKRVMRNAFGLESTEKKRERERERERERKRQARRPERKLTTPSLFFFDVNFIATSWLFTDKFVPAPDSECRLCGLPGPDEDSEDRDTTGYETTKAK